MSIIREAWASAFGPSFSLKMAQALNFYRLIALEYQYLNSYKKAEYGPFYKPLIDTQRFFLDNFNFTISTVNGSGSQSANNILLKTLFRSGYIVSGKNIFPSNIAGLPTTYSIRINKKGFTSYQRQNDLLVSMNPSTIEQDLEFLNKGSKVLYNSNLKINTDDFSSNYEFIGVPFKNLAREISKSPNMVKFLTNMTYVGVLSYCLDLNLDTLKQVVKNNFSGKPAVIESNLAAIELGLGYARENIDYKAKLFTGDMATTKNKILIDGNTSAALGLVYGGCQFMSWYPITPSSSVAENYIKYSEQLLINKEGEKNFSVVQAEDELSAISMVLGAGWSGARAVTPTSGPGLSLMAEAAGLSYFAEIPSVIWDVQRAGPSTGLPTRTLQGDLATAANLSHGDTEHIVLIPSTPQECFQMAEDCLNISEQFQTLVIVLSDLDLGMNQWMSDGLKCDFKDWQRGKVLSSEQLNTMSQFNRYEDTDNDGVCYRTLPGTNNDKAGYFTRGTGHNIDAAYSESPEVFEALLKRLKTKIESSRNTIPAPIVIENNNDYAVICYGSSEPACLEAIDSLKINQKINLDYMRIKSFPFADEVENFIDRHKKIFVVDLNRDGQMHKLLQSKYPSTWDKLTSVTHFNGLPIDAGGLADTIHKHLTKGQA